MTRYRALHVSAVIVAFFMPWAPAALPVMLGLLVLAALIDARPPFARPTLASPLPWMAALYLWHVVGMAWSTDLDFGWLDLGIKASLLVLPLIAWIRPGLTQHTVQHVFRWYAVACALFMLVLIVRAFTLYGIDLSVHLRGGPMYGRPYYNHLFSSYFSWYVHPSYLALFACLALAGWSLTGEHARARRAWGNAVVGLLLTGIVLCSSKMGWISAAVVVIYVLLVQWRVAQVRRTMILMGSVAAVVFAVLYVTIPGVRGKVEEAARALETPEVQADNSSAARTLVWGAAVELARRSPWLGTGTGDVKDELVRAYREKGLQYPLEHRLNAHSQFLQTWVALGIPGLLLLLGAVVVPLLAAIRKRQHLLVVLLLLCLLNWTVESMLEVQAGVLFFAFFGLVLTWRRPEPDARPAVVLLTQYFPPETGAPQNRLLALARRLKQRGADVTVLTAMPNYPAMRVHEGYRGKLFTRERIEGIEVHRAWLAIPAGRGILPRLVNYFSFTFTSFIAGLFSLGRTDVIIVESPPLFLGLSGIGLARIKGARLVFNVSDLWPESAVQLGLVTSKWMIGSSHRLEMACYREAALISGQTMGIVENIRARCPEKLVHWLPNGVDLQVMNGVRPVERSALDLPADAVIFCYAGIIGHAQGLDVVLRAAARLKDTKALFLLVGDGPERTRLEALAGQLHLENLRFVRSVPREDALALMAACDSAVVPLRAGTLFEGAIPSKIFEALALGKPLLLGVDGEARKLFIEQGDAGIFVPPEDDAALAEAALRIINDRALRERLGANGARYVREHFDRDRIGDAFWTALRPLFDPPASGMPASSILER